MNCVFKVYLLLIFSVVIVYGQSLYSPNDGLVLLENDTILANLYDSPVAWFVEFYSSWCGHCQSFAPSWKRLAKEVKGWTHLIRVAAIDCAEARNHETCANFSIQGYPSLKFFNAYTSNTSDIGEFYLGKRSPREMRHAMIDFLELNRHRLDQQVDFKPLETKLSDQFYIKKYKSKHIALVFENSTSYLGRELTLDLTYTTKVFVKRVVDDEKRKRKYNVTRLPHVVMLVHNKPYHLKRQTRDGILGELKGYHVKQMKVPTPKDVKSTNLHFIDIHKNDTQIVSKPDFSIVYMQDLEGALTSIFRQELVIKKTYGNERQRALEGFVDLLLKCFPGRPPIMNFLRLFQKWLSQRNSASPITPDKLHQFYAEQKDNPSSQLPMEVNWKACLNRGYPCSLWLLFHTLTVKCRNRKLTELSGADVLVRIRGFIVNFFGCVECAKHFYAMSKNVENEVHSFDEGILWLWKAHNRVNKRLSKEPTVYPKYPKIQYPPKALCAECSDDDKDIHWKKNVVLQFLKVHYGVNNIRLVGKLKDDGSDEKDVSESVSYVDNRRLVTVMGLSMTGFDTSLCLIVYGAGIGILIVLYVYILRKRRRHTRYSSLNSLKILP